MIESRHVESLERVRDHTQEIVQSALQSDDSVLVEAPPNSGKTTSAIELATQSKKPITYLAGRIDLYEQAEEWCEQQDGIRYERIPAPQRDCPSFPDGENGSTSAIERLYAKGYSGREIHLRFSQHAPCGTSCEYYQKLNEIDDEIESIDFLIGHHSHSRRYQYVRDRVVIIDEFDPEPFVTSFPDESSHTIDDPGKIIPWFLKTVGNHDQQFPADTYQDVTDLIQKRDNTTEWSAAVEWFTANGANRQNAQRFEFLDPSATEYNKAHAYAPFLTLSSLCMEKISPGIEVAPPRDGTLDEIWTDANLGKATKCLRDRNTGAMYSLQPPDLTDAAQVIGLDGTPTVELWNLLFAPETGFDHQQVISRDDFASYLESSMNMSVAQIGGGMHPYADGRVSDLDEQRFAAVQARSRDEFALISTKKALKRYEKRGWLDRFVRRTEATDTSAVETNSLFSDYQALNYGMIESSNVLQQESVGVVAGMPFPSDDLVKRWAGFCGQSVEVSADSGGDGKKSFGEFGDKIYRYFAHHRVVQAVLRFGRDEAVRQTGGATVYVSTEALPEWFETDTELKIHAKQKESAVLATLFNVHQSEERPSLAFRTVAKLYELTDADQSFSFGGISKRGVRNALEKLSSHDHVVVSEDRGANSADMYRWAGDGRVAHVEDSDHLLVTDDHMYAFTYTDTWPPSR